MMQWIAEKIVAALDRQGVLRHSSKEVYVYGFDIAIYTFVSTLGLFFIGWIGGKPWETILLIALYYTNQSAGGGFHASSHLNCFLSMAAGVVVFLLTFHFPSPVQKIPLLVYSLLSSDQCCYSLWIISRSLL